MEIAARIAGILGAAAGIDLHVVTTEVAGTPSRAPALELYAGRHGRGPAELEVERRVAALLDRVLRETAGSAPG
ncbi:hypothetical protein AB0C07_38865 [Actinoplanes missouriensis]|uniref:hypothetical protein n=1 Tax=Actinoplanes missouriensis TaxID=1866 RepID=UPI0033FA4456